MTPIRPSARQPPRASSLSEGKTASAIQAAFWRDVRVMVLCQFPLGSQRRGWETTAPPGAGEGLIVFTRAPLLANVDCGCLRARQQYHQRDLLSSGDRRNAYACRKFWRPCGRFIKRSVRRKLRRVGTVHVGRDSCASKAPTPRLRLPSGSKKNPTLRKNSRLGSTHRRAAARGGEDRKDAAPAMTDGTARIA